MSCQEGWLSVPGARGACESQRSYWLPFWSGLGSAAVRTGARDSQVWEDAFQHSACNPKRSCVQNGGSGPAWGQGAWCQLVSPVTPSFQRKFFFFFLQQELELFILHRLKLVNTNQ